MTRLLEPHLPVPYALTVEGHLHERWATWFGADVITHEDTSTTTLLVEVADQAELHGLLSKVRDLGATLISVTRRTPGTREPSFAGPS